MQKRGFAYHFGQIDRSDPSSCWEWPGTIGGNGYGYVGINGKSLLAHRVVYEFLVGPIPEGLTLDHLCMNPPCVNPVHLDPCTSGENSRRSPSTLTGKNVRVTHCPQGHEYAGDNLYYDQGKRKCRICVRAKNNLWRANNPMTPERHERRMQLQRERRARA